MYVYTYKNVSLARVPQVCGKKVRKTHSTVGNTEKNRVAATDKKIEKKKRAILERNLPAIYPKRLLFLDI